MSDYFKQLVAGAETLDAKADAYMASKPFLPNDEVIDRIWAVCLRLFKEHGGRYEGDTMVFADLAWDDLPWWAAQSLDGWMPFVGESKNGSLAYALGHSAASRDAHLRNIMEIAEGRETEELTFPVTFALPGDG